MAEWATFHGSTKDIRYQYELTAVDGNGVFVIAKDAVSFEHNKVSVRVGAIVTIIKQSQGLEPLASYVPNDGCEHTCSIGLVEVRCSDGRILGACMDIALNPI